MKFSFIIITQDTDNWEFRNQVFNSIYEECKDIKHEVIVVDDKKTKVFSNSLCIYQEYERSFTDRQGWITAKKNYGASLAKYDILVFCHDYIKINQEWLNGFYKFGYDWDICTNIILNTDNSRFRDNCSWGDPKNQPGFTIFEPWCPNGLSFPGSPKLESYDYNNPYWFISGAYLITRKEFFNQNRFEESLVWGQGEDVLFCLQARNKKAKYMFNKLSSCKLLKYKDIVFEEAK